MNILEEIAVKTRERIAQEKRQVPQEVLLEKIKERESLEQSGEKKRPVRTFLEALQKPGMSYICEVKRPPRQKASSRRTSRTLQSQRSTKTPVLPQFPA